MRYLILLLCLSAGTGLAAPRVVTSIVPLQEIGAALMAGVATPEVIIEGHASAHHFALKPSHMRRLQQADLVIWLDDHFESGFRNIAATLPAQTRRLELVPKISPGIDDGHLWYSPGMIARIADLIGEALEDLDPANRAIYRENRDRLQQALLAWREATLQRGLPDVEKVVSEHDFTIHFTNAFGLAPIPSVHDDHHDHGGLKELGQLEQTLRQRGVNCLLTFTGTPSALARRLVEKYRLRVVNLDSMRTDPTVSPAIIARLEQLRLALQACAD